ncbi:hypothetical protein COEREDRAFT_12459 [Coemansia reversa NRRL 1564]|uniref:Uncharacterized protein n=1 Tax=Coemansia reversa (strain ATCC 12441 / NRRL 1564) TaxID=763665 RepID=A0A2G5B0W6_COERN|nr:hypothetical protein COEREDRAFT_12459 [Coemansia reversa NRRL 1564]|eukprot:PIA12649.1 hypothetical protein COEREDRAFT_12459 [Coemansia reversa NRRL 1564]
MFEPVHGEGLHQSQELSAEDEALHIQPENRSLGLLLVDPATREYVEPELHDCRVRCVFDGIESRGIIYRAKRMQARLIQHLRTDRQRYIRVYSQRMEALNATGKFNPIDMQIIHGYLTMLRNSSDLDTLQVNASAQDCADRADHRHDTPLSSNSLARAVVSNGVLRKRAVTADVEHALVQLVARFSLPPEFVGSPEFRKLCTTIFTAQMDGSLKEPFSIDVDDYSLVVDRQWSHMRSAICRRLTGASHYSVLLHGRHKHEQHVIVTITLEIHGQRHLLEWVESDIRTGHKVLAQNVVEVLNSLKLSLGANLGETANMPPLLAVVSSGSFSAMCEVRRQVANSIGCCYHMQCTAQLIDTLASSLLEEDEVSERVTGCSTALVAVAQAVANNEEARRQWAEHEGQHITMPHTQSQLAEGYLRLFRQIVAVDYEFLLSLKGLLCDAGGSILAGHFDVLLNRGNAQMFLALVQLLALLEHCQRLLRVPCNASLADMVVILARLEHTLDGMASGCGARTSEAMQLVAQRVLARFRIMIGCDWDGLLLSALLAHSLSLYPGCSIREAFIAPLTLSQLLSCASEIWSLLHRRPDSTFSLPELYARWAAFQDALDSARATHADELPSTFSSRRILNLVGLGAEDRPELEPMASVAAALCDGPVVSASSDVLDVLAADGWVIHVSRLSDPMQHKELLVAAVAHMEQSAMDATSLSPDSVAQRQNELLNSTIDDVQFVPEHSNPSILFEDNTAVVALWQDSSDVPIDDSLQDLEYGTMDTELGDSSRIVAYDSAESDTDSPATAATINLATQSSITADYESADPPSLPRPTILMSYFDPAKLLSFCN